MMFEMLRQWRRKDHDGDAGDPVDRESQRAMKLFGGAGDVVDFTASQRPGRFAAAERAQARTPKSPITRVFVPGLIIGGAMGFILLIDDPSDLFGLPTRWLGKGSPAPAYIGCAKVRLTGADPIHRGDPGYSPLLDTDGDGVACEPVFAEGGAKGKR